MIDGTEEEREGRANKRRERNEEQRRERRETRKGKEKGIRTVMWRKEEQEDSN